MGNLELHEYRYVVNYLLSTQIKTIHFAEI